MNWVELQDRLCGRRVRWEQEQSCHVGAPRRYQTHKCAACKQRKKDDAYDPVELSRDYHHRRCLTCVGCPTRCSNCDGAAADSTFERMRGSQQKVVICDDCSNHDENCSICCLYRERRHRNAYDPVELSRHRQQRRCMTCLGCPTRCSNCDGAARDCTFERMRGSQKVDVICDKCGTFSPCGTCGRREPAATFVAASTSEKKVRRCDACFVPRCRQGYRWCGGCKKEKTQGLSRRAQDVYCGATMVV
jgi:hypothetical protein